MDTANTIPASGGRRYYRLGDLPPADYAPRAYCDLLAEYAPAYEAMQKKRDAEAKIRSELKHADATYLSETAEAARAGKAKKDPRPAIKARLEAAEVETAGAEQVCVDLSLEIYNIRQDPDAQAWWKGATDAVRAELMERAERQRSELEQTMAECAEVDWIAEWARGGNASRAVLGVSELGKLAKLIEQHADRRPIRHVSPAAMFDRFNKQAIPALSGEGGDA